jgi:hypothetical protein
MLWQRPKFVKPRRTRRATKFNPHGFFVRLRALRGSRSGISRQNPEERSVSATAADRLPTNRSRNRAAARRRNRVLHIEGAASGRVRAEADSAHLVESDGKHRSIVLHRDRRRRRHAGIAIDGLVRYRAIARRDGDSRVARAVPGVAESKVKVASDCDRSASGTRAAVGNGNIAAFAAVAGRAVRRLRGTSIAESGRQARMRILRPRRGGRKGRAQSGLQRRRKLLRDCLRLRRRHRMVGAGTAASRRKDQKAASNPEARQRN